MIQFDGKMKNLALSKLATYHRDKGDDVTLLDLSSFDSDLIYGSKIFMGGSGYNINAKLPDGIEVLTPDYEKFDMDYSQGFLSRGCVRDCDFCIVREKEGALHDVNGDWIKHQKVIVMDNNFLASEKHKERLQMFIDKNLKINFNQGLDIRLVNQENAELLSKTLCYDRTFKHRRIYFAFDSLEYENDVRRGIELLLNAGINKNDLMFYIIVGFDTTFDDDMYRYKVLWEEYKIYPYIQIYNNRKDVSLIRHFARWVNKRIHKVVMWDDYKRKMSKDGSMIKNEDKIW